MRKQASLLFAVALVAGAGCNRASPIRYNNILAVNNWYLADAAKTFKKSLDPLSKGQSANPKEVRDAYALMEKKLQEARGHAYTKAARGEKESKGELFLTSPPRFSGRGWRMHYAYLDFLDGQEKILKNQFAKIVETVDRAPPDQQWAIIKPLLDEAAAEEEKTYKPLQEAQKAYAHIYDANLEPLPTKESN